MADYVLPLEFSGQVPDFRILSLTKHPLQAILRHYFKGQPITVKILNDRHSLEIDDYNGAIDELRRALSIANRTQAKHGPELARIRLDAEHVYEITNLEDAPEIAPETDETLRIEVQALEDLLTIKQDIYERENKEAKDYAHGLEGELKAKEKEIEGATKGLRTDIENLEKANKGILGAKRKAEEDAHSNLERLKKLESDYASLSKTIEDISATKVTEPATLAMQKVSEASPSLEQTGKTLERFLQDGADTKKLLAAGDVQFYIYANTNLAKTFKSDEEALHVLDFSVPFEESIYAKENSAKYEQAKKVLPLLEQVSILSGLGVVTDASKALEIEAQLKTLKEDYERREKEHKENFAISGDIIPLKEYHDKAKVLVTYSATLKDKKIPSLVTLKYDTETFEVSFPKAGPFFSSQLEGVLTNALEMCGLPKDVVCSNTEGSVSYALNLKNFPKEDILQDHGRLIRALFNSQRHTSFYKLGMRLQINALATLA